MQRLLLGLAAVFALLVGLRVHGFSLAVWHEVIDGSAPSEVLIGAPRAIRSDDWKVSLPFAFSQAAQTPRFPAVNPLIGLGQSAWLPIEAPVAHPLAAFRPTLWGYFLGDDVGMAWQWWSRVLGLFAVWTGVLRIVAGGRLGLAAGGAALLVASPFFEFWAFNAAPHAAAMGAAFLALVGIARAQRPAAIAACGAALAAAGAWFALAVYPPYQVTLAWLLLALGVGFWLDARHRLALGRHAALRAVALAGAVLAAAGVAAAFAWEARDAIAVMQGTVYPGRRIATGGDRPLWQLANANFASGAWADDWGPLHNVCEGASFWLLAPVPVALWLWRAARDGAGIDRFALPVIAYQAALIGYAALGVPESIARASALSFVPGRRAVIGIGLADVILLVRFLAVAAPAQGVERRRAALLALAWAGALAGLALPLARALPGASLALLLALAAGNGVVAWLALAARERGLALAALVAASLASAAWFNPVAVGGSAWLRENPLSRRIVEIDRATPGGSTWVAFGRDDLPNLFRAIGVRSLNGLQALPQLELWRRIDPDGRARRVYDRYAHVAFVAAPTREPAFQLHSQDYVIVRVDPRSGALSALGATHALFRGAETERAAFERLAGFEHVASVGENHLYRIPRPAP